MFFCYFSVFKLAKKQKNAAYKFINEKVAFYQGEDRKLYDGKQNPWYPENVKTRLNKNLTMKYFPKADYKH